MTVENTTPTRWRATGVTAPESGAGGEALARVDRLTAAPWAEALALAGILLLAAILDFWRLAREGYANTYYAAAVRSMLQSWHNFFFVSFDPGGFVTVDKPPLGFWIQTASAKLFGFHGWSLLLPQALAGVLSVAVLYLLVRRTFGSMAGLIAALALAITPVSVVTNRNNTIDSLLVLCLLLAAGAALLAVERGSLRWLLVCALLVGAGFNIKMLQAYLALPALFLIYLVAAPLGWRRRIIHLTLAAAVLAAVSLSWAVAVDLTPPSQRPYVGSSRHNSELELAVGYNGINRLLPNGMFPGGGPPGPAAGTRGRLAFPAPPGALPSQAILPAQPGGAAGPANIPGGPPPGGPGFGGETGARGPLRLFSEQLGGQASWLLPLAVLGLVAAWGAPRLRRLDRRQQSLLLWGVWLLTGAVFFSVAGFFHRYYLIMIAPPVAALAGAGFVALWHDYRHAGWRGWLLPATLLLTAAVQGSMLRFYPSWARWLTPLIAGVCVLAVVVLVLARLRPRLRLPAGGAALAASAGMLALLLVPFVWSATTAGQNSSGMLPAAGPVGAGFPFPVAAGSGGTRGFEPPAGFPAAPPFGPGQEIDSALVSYLQANRGGARFLVAAPSSMTLSQIIISTGEPVMAMGGFGGADPILTPEALAQAVKSNTVRFFLGFGQPGQAGPLPPGAPFQAPAAPSSSVTIAAGNQAGAPQLPSPPFPGGPPPGLPPSQLPTGAPPPNFAAGMSPAPLLTGAPSLPPPPSSGPMPSSGLAGAPPAGGFGPPLMGGQSELQDWIASHCAIVPASAWRSTANQAGGFGPFGAAQPLYDCAGAD